MIGIHICEGSRIAAAGVHLNRIAAASAVNARLTRTTVKVTRGYVSPFFRWLVSRVSRLRFMFVTWSILSISLVGNRTWHLIVTQEKIKKSTQGITRKFPQRFVSFSPSCRTRCYWNMMRFVSRDPCAMQGSFGASTHGWTAREFWSLCLYTVRSIGMRGALSFVYTERSLLLVLLLLLLLLQLLLLLNSNLRKDVDRRRASQ